MTPDAVLFRYLEILSATDVDTRALVDLVAADADLMARWLKILDLPASRLTLTRAIDELDAHELRTLADMQVWSVLPVNGSARLSLDLWQGVLRSAVLAAQLVSHITSTDADPDVQTRALLGLSGVNLSNDPLLSEINEFRGTHPRLLEDADLELRVFAVVDAVEVGRDESLAAQLLHLDAAEYSRIAEDAERLTREQIDQIALHDEPELDWSRRIWLLQQVNLISTGLQGVGKLDELVQVHERICANVFPSPPLILLERQPRELSILGQAERRLSLDSETSQIAANVRRGVSQRLRERPDMAVIDRQLIRLAGGEEVYAAVAPSSERPNLVLLANTDADVDIEVAADLYVRLLGEHVARLSANRASPAEDRLAAYRDAESQRLREIVHEANNPLSIVRNYLHILELRLQNDTEASSQLQLVATELQRAGEIFARARHIPDEVEVPAADTVDAFKISPWLRDVFALQQGLANNLNVQLVAEIADSEREVNFEKLALTQILTNLLKNALEASPPDANVTLRFSANAYRNRKAGGEISVIDEAGGLPANVLSSLTDAKTSDKEGEGRGVGLKIAYELADAQGLQLDLSTGATGTTFTLFLPWPANP